MSLYHNFARPPSAVNRQPSAVFSYICRQITLPTDWQIITNKLIHEIFH